MDFLSGSYNAQHDRKQFFKSCFLFWVLGAIDGHAKNFSIFIKSGGRFELTPFYDVMSAYPLANNRQLEWRKLKMAMSVKGKHKHYRWHDIKLRHWATTAAAAKLAPSIFEEIKNEVLDNIETAIDNVTLKLPTTFPASIADSIFDGMRKIKSRCV